MKSMMACILYCAALCAGAVESARTMVFLSPEKSSFWHTATNDSITVPIPFPEGATRAELSVVGVKYERVYSDISDAWFTFSVPAATTPETENVYELTLAFNDAAATTMSARLGMIAGLDDEGAGSTRCIAPVESLAWPHAKGRAVLPVPCGTTSLTIDGVDTDTGLDGAQGWYALDGIRQGVRKTLALTSGETLYSATILGTGGMLLLFR